METPPAKTFTAKVPQIAVFLADKSPMKTFVAKSSSILLAFLASVK